VCVGMACMTHRTGVCGCRDAVHDLPCKQQSQTKAVRLPTQVRLPGPECSSGDGRTHRSAQMSKCGPAHPTCNLCSACMPVRTHPPSPHLQTALRLHVCAHHTRCPGTVSTPRPQVQLWLL